MEPAKPQTDHSVAFHESMLSHKRPLTTQDPMCCIPPLRNLSLYMIMDLYSSYPFNSYYLLFLFSCRTRILFHNSHESLFSQNVLLFHADFLSYIFISHRSHESIHRYRSYVPSGRQHSANADKLQAFLAMQLISWDSWDLCGIKIHVRGNICMSQSICVRTCYFLHLIIRLFS